MKSLSEQNIKQTDKKETRKQKKCSTTSTAGIVSVSHFLGKKKKRKIPGIDRWSRDNSSTKQCVAMGKARN